MGPVSSIGMTFEDGSIFGFTAPPYCEAGSMPTRKLLFLDLPIEVNMGAVAWVPGFHLWQSFFVFVNEECLIQIHRLHGCQQQIVKTYLKVKCVFYVFTPKPPICRLGAGIYCNAFYLNLKPQCFNGTKALDENLKT